MKIAASIIERTREPLEIGRTRKPLARAAGRLAVAKPQSGRLDFRMQRQLHSNWCWAAVATSVAVFYDATSKWTQCGVANQELGHKNCCRNATNGRCNKVGHLKYSLAIVGHAEQPPSLERPVSFALARREIDKGRPLGVRTQWTGGEIGHFLAIVGYHDGFELLTVDDPHYGRSHVGYDTFRADYRGAGTWTHSYYTKP